MYAPHHTIPHLVKYSTALTEITEHCRACFRLFRTLLNQTKPYVSLDKNWWIIFLLAEVIMQFRTYNEGNNSHEKKQLSYQNLTNNHQFRFSY